MLKQFQNESIEILLKIKVQDHIIIKTTLTPFRKKLKARTLFCVA
jgi:hypothetical protein